MPADSRDQPPSREPSEAWLRAADERCRAADIRPSRRAWFAVKDYAGQHRTQLARHDPVVQRIFDWFSDNAR